MNANGVFSGHTSLQAASQNGHVEVIRILLSHGADPEVEDRDGDRAVVWIFFYFFPFYVLSECTGFLSQFLASCCIWGRANGT